ncbi:MAG: hypothetical protein V3S41_06620, partial [Spirochaetia bacterium]
MGDFGKILEQWDGRRSKPPSGTRSRPEQDGLDQMNRWLDKYPPEDMDLERPDVDHPDANGSPGNRANPEKLKTDDTLELHGYRLQEAIEVTGAYIEQ